MKLRIFVLSGLCIFSQCVLPEDIKGIDFTVLQAFQKNFDEKYFEINHDFEKLRHILLHLMKTVGKMAAYCEIKEHGRTEPDSSEMIDAVLPDLLIHALQIANHYNVDLGEKYKERIQYIINRSHNS